MPNSWRSLKFSNNVKAAGLLFFFAVIIYSNSLGGEFIYDDEYFIVKNIHIKNLENIPSFFVNPTAVAFAELSQDVYRPITAVSYALDYHFWKLDTFGYHLVNVLFHALNAILLFFLLQLVFSDIFIAFLASLFFICHPVQTEVVSWISGRSSVLFLFFYLSAFICYILYTRRPRKMLFAASLILFINALFSKEMAVSLPLLLIAYEIHFGLKESIKRKIARVVGYFLLAGLFVLVRYLVISRVSQTGWWGGSPYYTFLTMLVVIGDYLKLLIAPLKLCAFYVTTIYDSFAITKVLIAIAFLTGLIAAMPYIFRSSRRASFAICIFFITLLPVSNIVPLRALMAERFLYLPSIGFYILAAIVLQRIARMNLFANKELSRRIAIFLAALLVLFYSARTMLRNDDWKTTAGITNSILELDPLNPWALMSLGVTYSTQERYAEAIKPLVKAIVLSDSYFAPKSVLGFCYLQLGRFDDAIKLLAEALKIRPDNLEALNSLGVAFAQSKRYAEAIEQFEHAIKVDPSFIDGYINLATAYNHMGQAQKAIEVYKAAISRTRNAQAIAIVSIRIGDIYIFTLNDPGTAKKYYEEAMAFCGPGMEDLKKIAIDRLSAPSI